jgi:hypothetical protein
MGKSPQSLLRRPLLISASIKSADASRARGYNFILRTEDGRGFQDWSVTW